jgi:hypothetical protein
VLKVLLHCDGCVAKVKRHLKRLEGTFLSLPTRSPLLLISHLTCICALSQDFSSSSLQWRCSVVTIFSESQLGVYVNRSGCVSRGPEEFQSDGIRQCEARGCA